MPYWKTRSTGLGCLLEAARILPSMVAVQGIRGVSRGFEGIRRGGEEDVQQGGGQVEGIEEES